jgi:hypothetical protein
LGNNPLKELVNEPAPVPSLVLLFRVVGEVEDVLQQTPRAVIVVPPSFVTTPPLIALVAVIEVVEVVLNSGTPDKVLKETSLPYVVPKLFVT